MNAERERERENWVIEREGTKRAARKESSGREEKATLRLVRKKKGGGRTGDAARVDESLERE